MKFNLSLAKDICHACTSALGYIMLFLIVLLNNYKDIPAPYCLLGIPLILVGCQLIQYYCFHPVLYVLLHGALWIPVLLIPFSYVEYRYLLLFVLLCESAKAIQAWKTASSPKFYEGIPWVILTCTCIFYTIACGYKMGAYAFIIYYIGIGVLLLHFIQLFIAGLTKLVAKSKQATSVPTNKIMLTSGFIFILFAIIFVIASTFIHHSSVENAFSALGQMLIRIIRLITRTITYIVTLISVFFSKHSLNAEMEDAEQGMEEVLEEIQEPSLLAQILQGCIMIAAMFVAIYLVYRMLTAFVRIFSKRYVQDTDIVIEANKPKETTKKPKKKNSLVKRLQEFLRNDNASKIRRAYRLKVSSYKPVIFKKQDTPTDIAIRIDNTYNEDITELTEVYEKARYSNEEITFDDVQKGGLL